MLQERLIMLDKVKENILRHPNTQFAPTIISLNQIKSLVSCAVDCLSKDLEGDVVELGCYVGESSKYLRITLDELSSNKKLYVYDSFSGLPELSKWEENTGWQPNTLKTSEEVLISNFQKNNLTPPIIYKSWFKDIPDEKLPEKISLAFLDGDFYDSIYDSLNKVYERIVPGGYILIHDYGRTDLPGVEAACKQFAEDNSIDFKIELLCDQLALFIKPLTSNIKSHNSQDLNSLLAKHGSDKHISGYSSYYSDLFNEFREKEINFLEIGLGTLDPNAPSTFIGNLSLNKDYKPAGILRAWRDYFSRGSIFGIDIANDCMISEERIKTFLGSSSDINFVEQNFSNNVFDFILDDGDHSADAQISTFRNFFEKLKDGGLYIIEDIGGSSDSSNVFVKYNEELLESINRHEYFYYGNILIVRKNYSNKGMITFDAFKNFGIDTPNIVVKNNFPHSSDSDNLTIVSGLWDINRVGRDWDRYKEHFDKFLNIPCNMVLWIPKSLESFVWDRRCKSNTFVRIYELDDIKQTMFSPFFEKVQNLRLDHNWQSLAPWLSESPQCKNEYYNPIVMSKMFFLHDSKTWNPFDTDYFIWLDAGITQTVYENYFYDKNILSKFKDFLKPFLFLSYPYEADNEIHGFEFNSINKFAGEKVDYVCRGGLFGGHKDFISQANSEYYNLLNGSLNEGKMGTEESVFSIMAKLHPENYRRFSLDGNGLVVKFLQALESDSVDLEPFPSNLKTFEPIIQDLSKVKTNLYFLTFNFPEQLEATIKSLQLHDNFLTHPTQKVIIDNSTNPTAIEGNRALGEKYGFKHIAMNKNTGICGGRQFAAEHFDKTDSDFYLFFEDDMTISDPEEGICRNGFQKYIPDLYKKIHQIMIKEKFDFLKLSYTEVYMDNNIQVSWYNVPQEHRTKTWPHYDKLPITGLDPNCPRTNFKNIEVLDGLSYISGEIYYANWPHITSREGNKKMFINTKWAHPYEQTWMSHIFQESQKGNIKPAVLLASAVTHDRFKYYKAEERIEG